jgi:hypothetical protein
MNLGQRGAALVSVVVLLAVALFVSDLRLVPADAVLQDAFRVSLGALLALVSVHAARNGGLGG